MKLSNSLLLLLAAGVLYIAGCSASTSSIRFDDKKNDDEKESSSLRYSNIDTTKIEDFLLDEFSSEDDFEEEPSNVQKIDLTNVYKDYVGNQNLSATSSLQENFMMGIIKYLKTPYKFGGTTLSGIDCSALTQNIYKDVLSVELPRTAREQFTHGLEISKENLQFGDLVFFNTRRRVRPGHVGVYIGDNLFAHASRSNGVTVTQLSEEYYTKRFMGARRILENWEIK